MYDNSIHQHVHFVGQTASVFSGGMCVAFGMLSVKPLGYWQPLETKGLGREATSKVYFLF